MVESRIFSVVSNGFAQLVEDLKDLVRTDSVSADAFDQGKLRTSANQVAALFQSAGVENARVIELETSSGKISRPAILGEIPGPAGSPTVLLYAHHDVQPPGNSKDWNTDPFDPVQKEDRIYGRGAGDDKAGVVLHLGTLRAWNKLGDLPVGVKIFIEGEEEIGSPTFLEFLDKYKEELEADVIIVADSSNWKIGTPSLTTSLRGVVTVDVELAVLDHALHSGQFGGPILDAVTVMCKILSTLHDTQGNVAVEGLKAQEPVGIADYPESCFRSDAGVLDGVALAGSGPLASRIWNKPAISVIGMDVTPCATASNTLWPSCKATISIRVAPGQDSQDAADALVRHLESRVSFGAKVKVNIVETGPSFSSPPTSKFMDAMRAALEQAWKTSSQDIGQGGSIPFISQLQQTFPNAEVLVTGVEDPDTRAHSANESVHLGELEKAVQAQALFFAKISEIEKY